MAREEVVASEAAAEGVQRFVLGRKTLWVVTPLAIALSAFHLYTSGDIPFNPYVQRAVHLGTVLVLLSLARPLFWGRSAFLNWLIGALAALVCGYIVYDAVGIQVQAGIPVEWSTPLGDWDLQTPMGIILILLLLEGTRRTVGWPLPMLAILSLLYAYFGAYIPGDWGHSGFPADYIVGYLYLTTDGIWGLPVNVSATIIIMFVIFGAFLLRAGQGEYFTKASLRLAGQTVGGPAQVAVISSALVGTISGSAVGNVATTGAFSIPLMKSRGYAPYFAGAVEAAASTGGQIMPPVMGAGAFLMADILEVPYTHIALAAAIPAALYFANVGLSVRFEAQRLGLRGLRREELPSWGEVVKGFYLLTPLFILIYFLNEGYSPMRASFWAVATTVGVTSIEAFVWALRGRGPGSADLRRRGLLALAGAAVLAVTFPPTGPNAPLRFGLLVLAVTALVSLLRLPTRLNISGLAECLRSGSMGVIEVATACSSAGIVIGVTNLTGLGIKITALIVSGSQGLLILALLLGAAAAILLGMGLPTTIAYAIAGAVVAPALVQFGLPPLTAHLFVFYFSIIAVITPPVCLAAYVAAGMAGAPWLKIALTACKLALPSFIVPFLFIQNPALLLEANWPAIVWNSLTALVGIFFLAAGVIGHMYRPIRFGERPLYFVVAGLLMLAGIRTDLMGILLGGYLLWGQLWHREAPAVERQAFRPTA